MAVMYSCLKCGSTRALKNKKCACGADLTKPSNRNYRVQVVLGGRNGVAYNKTVRTLALARELEAKVREDYARESLLGHRRTGVPVINEVWRELSVTLTGPTAPSFYLGHWERYIKPFFDGKRLSEIRTADVLAFKRRLEDVRLPLTHNATSGKTKPLSASTIAKIMKSLKRIYHFAASNDMYRGRSPFQGLKLEHGDRMLTNYLQKDELSRLMHVLGTWPNRLPALAFMLCLNTGKRTGEVFGLTWDRVDFERGEMVFLIGKKKGVVEQTYFMNATSRQVLLEAKEHRYPGSQLVFHTCNGKLIQYRPIWLRIKDKAGLREEIRPHDLRHTFASLMANSGEVDIYKLKDLLAHNSIEMTERYAHLFDCSRQQAVSVMDRCLENA